MLTGGYRMVTWSVLKCMGPFVGILNPKPYTLNPEP